MFMLVSQYFFIIIEQGNPTKYLLNYVMIIFFVPDMHVIAFENNMNVYQYRTMRVHCIVLKNEKDEEKLLIN